jgi:hypothetical protein
MKSCHLFPPYGYPNLFLDTHTNKLDYQSSSLTSGYWGLPTQIERMLLHACTFLALTVRKVQFFAQQTQTLLLTGSASVIERRCDSNQNGSVNTCYPVGRHAE